VPSCPTKRNQPITLLLREMSEGRSQSDERIANAVVKSLERIAEQEMALRGGLHGMTLEPSVFAHDALLKVIGQRQAFVSRGQFFAYATQIMVHAMIDYHRARLANKRGGALQRVSMSDALGGTEPSIDIEAVPPALEALHVLDPRKADVVRLRVFWGATMDEIADLLNLSTASVERDWRFAKRWLAVHFKDAQRDA